MCFCSCILGWRAAVTAGAKENSQDCDTNIFECDLIYFSLKNIFSLLKVQRITGSRKGLSHARLSRACSLFPHLGTFSSITLCSNSWKMFVQVPLGKRLLTLMWSRQSREWVWFPLLRVHPPLWAFVLASMWYSPCVVATAVPNATVQSAYPAQTHLLHTELPEQQISVCGFWCHVNSNLIS